MAHDSLDHLSMRDFRRLAEFIHGYSGIKMPFSKKTMVEGRLRRRLRAAAIDSLAGYCRYVFDEGGMGEEGIYLIDAVTTNKTDFFREPEHFHFLTAKALPQLFSERRLTNHGPLKVWSAACSNGAEPYTLAMVLAASGLFAQGFRVSILATDICTEVLGTAVDGIYPESMIEPVPMELRRRYLLRGKNGARDRVRIVPELRQSVSFGRLNLMEAPYGIGTDMHVIFCRNILIYFDKATQEKVLGQLCRHLRPGGYLFLGHSETVSGCGLPLDPVATTVFRRM